MKGQSIRQPRELRSSPINFSGTTARYRRNGKLQACEPCRKSKLRCDHGDPCSRCLRRRGQACVYHPNPLSRQKSIAASGPLATPSSGSVATQDDDGSPTVVQTTEGSDMQTIIYTGLRGSGRARPAPVQMQRAASAPPLNGKMSLGVPHYDSGFLGLTSYSSIFADSKEVGDLADVSMVDHHKCQQLPVPEDRIQRGCKILSFLKDRYMINQFVARFYEIEEGGGFCIEPVVKQWLMRLWVHHDTTLHHQDPTRIRQLVELLWKNSTVPLAFDEHTRPKLWIQQSTGPGIRWAVIGLVAAIVGNCAAQLMPTDRLLRESKTTRTKLMKQMHVVVLACLDFCRECEVIDDMFVWLLIGNHLLTAALKREFSYAAYRASGEVINAAIVLGMHQPAKAPLPFFLAELRKRIFIFIYAIDVSMAAFLGRPCRLSHRYCEIQLPIDLADSQLVLEHDALVDAMSKIDPSTGFNTAGRFLRSTYITAWLSFSPRREDIIDLALGTYTRDELLRHATEIRRKTEERWASFPPWIRRLRDEPRSQAASTNSSRKMTSLETLFVFSMRGGFKSNELLLQRVLIRKAGVSPLEILVPLALGILKDTLELCQQTELAQSFPADMSYFLGVQGLRAAAIIATELLKQEQLPSYPRDPVLPRSQTIQDLAVYASRLGAVDPEDGMFVICDQGRKAITQILDKILKPPQPQPRPLPLTHGAAAVRPQLTQNMQDPQTQLHSGITPALEESFVAGLSETNPGLMFADEPSFWEIEHGSEGPFLGNDHDFMQWIENMNFEGPV